MHAIRCTICRCWFCCCSRRRSRCCWLKWFDFVVVLLLLLLAVIVLVVGSFSGYFIFVVCWFSLRASQTYTGKKWVKITNEIEWKSNTLYKLHRFEVLFQHFNLGRKLRYKIHLTQKTRKKTTNKYTHV